MHSVVRWSLTVASAIVVGVGVGVGANVALPEAPLVHGLFVGGRHVPYGVDASSWLSERTEWLTDRHVVLRDHDRGVDRLYSYTFEELGVSVDVEATIAAAQKVAHEGPLLHRLRETRAARQGKIDVPVVYRLDRDKVTALLAGIAKDIDRPSTDARIDLAHRTKIPDIVGRKLDLATSLASIEESSFDDGLGIDLTVEPVRARVTLEDLTNVNIEKVVSSFETTFHTWGSGAGRAVNIANAAHYIDGLIIVPDQVFSFNEYVGPRTLDRGFTFAPEIQGDELTTGVGGGTCQASTTLFGAALFGALEIIERRSHSRPSSYTKMGLDATVSYPSTDLKIRNSLTFPIMIHAFLPKSDTIRVEILGGDPVADVNYSYGVGSSEDFVRRITTKSFLPQGKRILRQKGSRGYSVTSLIHIKWRDGRTEERSYYSGYRPAPEVFWVGPGYDEKELPPLPEHARGVEGRGGEGFSAF